MGPNSGMFSSSREGGGEKRGGGREERGGRGSENVDEGPEGSVLLYDGRSSSLLLKKRPGIRVGGRHVVDCEPCRIAPCASA
jgi:hypothetical protein